METLIIICIAMFIGMILALIFGGVMGLFASFALFAAGVVLYFLPTILAIHKKNPSALWIFLVNVFFGWSVIGWILALIWAFDGYKVIGEFMEYRREKSLKPSQGDIIEGEQIKDSQE